MNDAVVVGGGFAGTAAACRLAAGGHRTLLLERAPRLGGRATSAPPRGPEGSIDYGQHVLMRCCSASTGFLARIAASRAVRFQSALSVPIVSPAGRSFIRSSWLPGFLHLAPSLLGYRALSGRERLLAMRAGAAALLGRTGDDAPFAEWLTRHAQSDRAIRRLWDPICVATLNAKANEAGVRAARKVLRDAFFRPGGADLGFFTVPLGEVFEAARRYLEERGGVVRTGVAVQALRIEGGRVRGVQLTTGETIEAASVVCAVPPPDLASIAQDAALADTIELASRLRWSPIVNVHAWFDRPVLDSAFSVVVESPLQVVFDVSALHDRPEGEDGFHVVLSQSAANDWIDRPSDDVSAALLDALGDTFPAARRARCHRALVIRHRRATLVPAPGSDRLRPPQRTGIRGLAVAGDWTATGWPSTIEGAIRSGVAAAAHAEAVLCGPSDPWPDG